MAACGKPGCKWCAKGQCWGSKGGKGKGAFGGNMGNMGKGFGAGLGGGLGGGFDGGLGGGFAGGVDPSMLAMLIGLMGAGGGGKGGKGKVMNKFNGGGRRDGGFRNDPNVDMEGKPGPKGEDPSTGRWTWGSNGANNGKKWKWKPFMTEEQRAAKAQKALLAGMMMS
eukprot:TRINITY_DN1086_c0_g1_i1.p2 TRINITY_DN1086_c0_g1~~TRINITY_DN1086_c0_g1_i1.p2  ORF type:complete len:167 (+),score=46.63 TRINITY_DN1086_c0_g1_i1:59-559(+)